MQVNLSSGDYNIVSSGQAFLFGLDKNLKISIVTDNNFEFFIVLKFRKDAYGEQKIDKKVSENKITLTCFNFDDLGTGLVKPLRIARIEGKEIFLLFWSYLEGATKGKVRSVKYTVFMSNKLGDDLNVK